MPVQEQATDLHASGEGQNTVVTPATKLCKKALGKAAKKAKKLASKVQGVTPPAKLDVYSGVSPQSAQIAQTHWTCMIAHVAGVSFRHPQAAAHGHSA